MPVLVTSFVIPVRNDASRLRRCLESIRRGSGSHEVRIIVVDNGSTDGSAEVARAAGATVFDRPGERVGTLRNLGAAAVEGDLLAFVDADHELGLGWLHAVYETMQDPRVGAVGAPYHAPNPGTWVQRLYDGFRDHRPGVRDVEWLGSGNLVVRSSAFRQVGGFDTTLEACEDVDFCQRLRRAGFTVASDSRLVSIHQGDPATLAALFRSELWRGRDNLRVSLRGPLTLAGVPSLVIPIIDLIALAAALVAGVMGEPLFALMAIAALLGLAALRAARLFQRLPDRTMADGFRALLVAFVYDLARAFAVIARVPHRRTGRSRGAAAAR
jgi:hypothetical protein